MEYTYASKSGEDTAAFGQRLAKALQNGGFIALNGELGAGKTVLVRGIARGLGIVQDILSPTFTLLRIYEGRLRLAHFDVYRIADEDELIEIGYDDFLDDNTLTVVEWACKIPHLLPEEKISLHIQRTEREGERLIQIDCAKSYEPALKAALC
jgi:tRNA threonylcarbamoyladenosine biosynthesis protein TsaE